MGTLLVMRKKGVTPFSSVRGMTRVVMTKNLSKVLAEVPFSFTCDEKFGGPDVSLPSQAW
jgi:hypothetical protein